MLTDERHQLILNHLAQKGTAKLGELVEITNSSESTIRRDLNHLEGSGALKRVHGGATLLKGRYVEPSYPEKQVKSIDEKNMIAKYAASLIEEGDCIYLDAGTTTYGMIDYIDKKVVVVTNGLQHIDALIEKGIDVYILGGKVKNRTKAIIGTDALKNLEKFRFDKCFLGMNGVHYEYGFTTPDSDEGILKESAIKYSRKSYVLVDDNKFGEVTFVKVADLDKATIITNKQIEEIHKYIEKTKVKVVKDI